MFAAWSSFVVVLITLLILRCIYLMATVKKRSLTRNRRKTLKTAIVIGSGGHTTEMFRIVRYLNTNVFTPRIYVVASSDDKSISKISDFEKQAETHHVVRIPRSRQVHQSYISSIFTTLNSLLFSIPVMFSSRPDLVLCNGPGTCVPICFLAFMMRVLFVSDNAIIFVESICRVKTLSLTGKILYYFADHILVQWSELSSIYPRATFIGDIKLWAQRAETSRRVNMCTHKPFNFTALPTYSRDFPGFSTNCIYFRPKNNSSPNACNKRLDCKNCVSTVFENKYYNHFFSCRMYVLEASILFIVQDGERHARIVSVVSRDSMATGIYSIFVQKLEETKNLTIINLKSKQCCTLENGNLCTWAYVWRNS
jgi:beta-1,4-N-acetylglucosaminyltransferase